MTAHSLNVDPAEIARFEALAHRWWDPEGELKTLHDINPTRLAYIERLAPLVGKRVVDVGCGGGILSETMAGRGATVTGLDAAEAAIQVATLHQLRSHSGVSYVQAIPEEFAEANPAAYDIVTCMELLEHVPRPRAVIEACARMLRPGGSLFFSTINRTPAAYLLAVIGAEYLLRLLPRGTHHYARFIRPAELASWVRSAGLAVREVRGMSYNPFARRASLSDQVQVNYLLHAVAP